MNFLNLVLSNSNPTKDIQNELFKGYDDSDIEYLVVSYVKKQEKDVRRILGGIKQEGEDGKYKMRS